MEKNGNDFQKFPSEPNPSLAFPKSGFSQPKSMEAPPFSQKSSSKKPKIPKSPHPSSQKSGKIHPGIAKKREKTSKKSQLCFRTFLFPPNAGGVFGKSRTRSSLAASRGESRDFSDPNPWNFRVFPASEELPMQDFPGHPLPEVGHVLLGEVDGFVLGDALGVFAGEHPAVAAVHLLRDLLALLA